MKVLGLLIFLAEHLEAESNPEAIAYIKYMGSIAEDDALDDERALLDLQRAWYAKSPLNYAPVVWREDLDQRVIAGAPVEAALDKIWELLTPSKPPGGSVFGKVSRE